MSVTAVKVGINPGTREEKFSILQQEKKTTHQNNLSTFEQPLTCPSFPGYEGTRSVMRLDRSAEAKKKEEKNTHFKNHKLVIVKH